jgi:hypothetical protein
MGEGEEKVDGENMKEKGCPILATGGTWELMGNDMLGAAPDNLTNRMIAAQAAAARDAIFAEGYSIQDELSEGARIAKERWPEDQRRDFLNPARYNLQGVVGP